MNLKKSYWILFALVCTQLPSRVYSQQDEHPVWKAVKAQQATLGVEEGAKSFTLKNLNVAILNASQTLSSFRPNSGEKDFDYTPIELLNKRDRNKFFHIGDITISLRRQGDTAWTAYSSAMDRKPVKTLNPAKNTLASADISPTLSNIPLKVVRSWKDEQGDLILSFELTNSNDYSVEIGSLGIPLPFNNNMDWKNLDQAHAQNVFFHP